MSDNKDLEFNIEEIEQIIAPAASDLSDGGEIDGGEFGDAIGGIGGGSGRPTRRHCPTYDITCSGNGGGGGFLV